MLIDGAFNHTRVKSLVRQKTRVSCVFYRNVEKYKKCPDTDGALIFYHARHTMGMNDYYYCSDSRA